MGLNYGYTCPIIDDDIDGLTAEIKSHLTNVVKELNPSIDFQKDDVKEVINRLTESLFGQLVYLFEETKKTNHGMRKTADKQIEDLENKLQNLKDINSKLKDKISSLKNKISFLENELANCN
jgi:septal ring factor EnvC (AmiA/AmiB activator)